MVLSSGQVVIGLYIQGRYGEREQDGASRRRCKCRLQTASMGCHSVCPGVRGAAVMGLLVCVWLGANRWHELTGVTVTLFSLLSCSPSRAVWPLASGQQCVGSSLLRV